MLTSNPLRLKAKFWPEADALRLGTYIRDRALFDGAHHIVFPEWGEALRPDKDRRRAGPHAMVNGETPP